MKRRLVNVLISILFSITLVLTIISLTVLNKNFVIKVMTNKGYVDVITNAINEEIKVEDKDYVVLKDDVQNYLEDYVKSRYKYEVRDYGNEASDIINRNILFMGKENYKKYSYIIYVVTLLSIIITGNIFLKSKRFHDLASIYIYSFIFMVIIYGVIYFNIDDMNYIVGGIINVLNHIILGVGIILLEIGVYKKRRFKKLS